MKVNIPRTILRMFPRFTFNILIIITIVLYLENLLLKFIGNHEERISINSICLSLIMVIYGISRVCRFHPVFNKAYLIQLALSPWSLGKTLPRGPVHLFWADLVIVGFFILLTFLFPVKHWLLLPFIFLIAYNIGLCISFCFTSQVEFIGLYVLLAPLAVYPHLNGIVTAVILLLMTGIGLFGIHCYFRGFPWNTNWWTENKIEKLKYQAITRRVIQWPFRELGVTRVFSGGLEAGIVFALLFFWYIHTIGWFIYKMDNERITGPLYAIPVFMTFFIRFLCYVVKYRPPISLFGRIRTGRFLVPGYDIVYVGPIIVLLVGIFMPSLLRMVCVPSYIAYELSISICIFLTLAVPPNFEKWHYTGQYRITAISIKPVPTAKNNQTNEIFQNLFKNNKTISDTQPGQGT